MATIVAYCTPSRGDVSIFWARTTACILHENNLGKGLFYLRDKVGGEVAESRNALVESVLDYDAKCHKVSHLFWVDDDVLVFPGCLLELLHKDRDIVSGVYFTKLPGNLSSPLMYPESGGGAAKFIPDKFTEVWGHGMGLTLIKTEVYKRMRDELLTREVNGIKEKLTDKYGRYRWYHTTDMSTEVSQDEHDLTSLGMTEDLHFLSQAQRLGYRPSVLTTKHCFGWHYDKDNDVGYPEKQWNQWISGEKITWDTPDGDVTWD